MKKLLLTLSVCLLLTPLSASAAVVLNAASGYEGIGGNSTVEAPNSTAVFNTEIDAGWAAMTFLMDQNMDASSISNAALSFYMRKGTTKGNSELDVYFGVTSNDSSSDSLIINSTQHLYTEYYDENDSYTGNLSVPGLTLVDDNLLPGNSGFLSLSETGESNLTTFLQNNYSQGDYLVAVFAIDPTTESPTTANWWRWEMSLADDSSNFSNVSFGGTVIPEPSALSLLAGVLGMILLFRRRR